MPDQKTLTLKEMKPATFVDSLEAIDAHRPRLEAQCHRSAVLQEEVGEVANAILQGYDGETMPFRTRLNLKEELTQVAAVAVA